MSALLSLERRRNADTWRPLVADLERAIDVVRRGSPLTHHADDLVATTTPEGVTKLASILAAALDRGEWEFAELMGHFRALTVAFRAEVARRRGEDKTPATFEERRFLRHYETQADETVRTLAMMRARIKTGEACPAAWLDEARFATSVPELENAARDCLNFLDARLFGVALFIEQATAARVAARCALERAAGKIAAPS